MVKQQDILVNDQWEEKEGIPIRKGLSVSTAFSQESQDRLFETEKSSWWFQYRAKVITTVVKRFVENPASDCLWDVGGGNGFTAWKMQEMGYDVALLEPSFEACKNARIRGVENVFCGTLDEESIMDGALPGIMVLDVVEHIKDDRLFLSLINRKLAKGGCCIITVPAFMSLWSSNDVSAGHFRRYKIKELQKLCKELGFNILYQNYFMGFLYLPILVMRVWMVKLGIIKSTDRRSVEERRHISNTEHKKQSGLVGHILSFVENRELKKIERGKRVLFGSSIIMVVKNNNIEAD